MRNTNTSLAGKGRGGRDDPNGHDAGDDHGGGRGGHGRGRGGNDDGAGHDAGDDKGGGKGGHGADDSRAAPMAMTDAKHGGGGGGDVRLRGDDNANLLEGGAGDDRIDGNGGNDTVNGLAGDDRLTGGDGDDEINAGSGSDRVDGGAGADTITSDNTAGGRADVRISDGAGDDSITLLGGDGTRVDIRSGSGADVISIDSADRLKLVDGAGADSIDISGDFGRAKIKLESVEPAQGDVNETDTIHLAADATFDRALRIDNFVAGDGGDVFDFADYLAANTSWDGASDPAAGGFIQLVQDGDEVNLRVDADGGADGFQTVVVFGDVLAEDFTDANLGLVV
jgi:hemolysin type calcium-binding protein